MVLLAVEGLPEGPLAAHLYADAYAVYAQGALYSFARAAQQRTLRIRGKADPDFRPIARVVGTYYGEIHEALCFADGIYALPSEMRYETYLVETKRWRGLGYGELPRTYGELLTLDAFIREMNRKAQMAFLEHMG